ncbi:putative s-adenosylmethionine-dependent methyltransferase protein [Eutypa lata UCREL1]|uniref:Protein-lysine N-methyltransferase EFM4 n=1 Tax=Eutypa lata (strain UCR-EL1) TaxID=1287681 RepID=M7SD56_EUTLA|nr:putative s-adenosylmethionine-dependent methyltransferase protein [Eutypa lata UCREL1]
MTAATAEQGGGASPSNNNGQLAHLEPSELGTKEYWDKLYDREIQNHAHDPTDTGTIWFDDSDAEGRVISFLCDHHAELLLPPSSFSSTSPSPPSSSSTVVGRKSSGGDGISFLDLGTGNGSLLFGLRDADGGEFAAGRMLGVDYSARSVEFARRIARGRRRQREEQGREVVGETEDQQGQEKEGGGAGRGQDDIDIEFELHDILHDAPARLLSGAQERGWDVVLDKGTFDAVSLSSEELVVGGATGEKQTTLQKKKKARRISEAYPRRVLPLVREGGLLVVTSCNWTEEELGRWFVGSKGEKEGEEKEGEEEEGKWCFEQVGRVEYPSFSFGGVKGQTISTLCFRKVRR